jgi:uncharacterized protein
VPDRTHELSDLHTLRNLRGPILRIARRRKATNIRVFGSMARGELDEASDLDLLVDMEPGRRLLDLGGLVMDLRDLLGVEVDVVTERALKPSMRERVLRDAVPL